MCQLVESIKIKNKEIENIEYHNKRFNYSRKKLYGIDDNFDLSSVINSEELSADEIYKCRVVYNRDIELVEFLPYNYRKIESLKIVYDDSIDYSFKYVDRSHLNRLFNLREDCDDILIIKNGFITDTFAGNIVFFDGHRWVTPDNPLLKGTKRQFLLDEDIIREKEITLNDLSKFKKASIINGMIGFKDCLVDIKNIVM